MFRRARVAALLTLPLIALAACSGADPDQQASAAPPGAVVNTSPEQNRVRAEAVAEIAATVPQAIRDRGELVVGTTGTGGPPLSFRADDDTTVIGVETDVAQLVADVLDLELRLEPTSWENLFLSVRSGQYDVGFSNITVTEERKDIYDFASYRVDTLAFEVPLDSEIQEITGPADVAGRTISVGAGTNQEEILLDWDAQTIAAGLEPVTFQYYENPGDYYLALDSGRIEAYLGPNPSLAYHVAVSGTTRIAGTLSGGGDITAEIAAMTLRGNGLVEPVNAALNTVIENGRYAEVLERWNLDSEAIEASVVNPPGLPRQPTS